MEESSFQLLVLDIAFQIAPQIACLSLSSQEVADQGLLTGVRKLNLCLRQTGRTLQFMTVSEP